MKPPPSRQTTQGDATKVRWVVRAGDGETVGEVARKAGADAPAIREGRVFVGRTRATSEANAVAVGDEVTVAPRLEAAAPVRVLADEDGVVAADKPAGVPTIPDHAGAAHSLLHALAAALECDPGALHPTSRLDRDVSGVVLFARTREAADRLAAARKEGAYARRYVAIACGSPAPRAGEWSASIGRAKDPRRRVALPPSRANDPQGARDAIPSRSRYEVVAEAGPFALLALDPITGRTHQLRVHAAHAGAPLLGDAAYGGLGRVVLPTGRVVAPGRIALHAARVSVPRASGARMEVRSEIPPALRALWAALGGDDAAWDDALRAPALQGGGIDARTNDAAASSSPRPKRSL